MKVIVRVPKANHSSLHPSFNDRPWEKDVLPWVGDYLRYKKECVQVTERRFQVEEDTLIIFVKVVW
jgi:hypothetical protein